MIDNLECQDGYWTKELDPYGWDGDETINVWHPRCSIITVHTYLDRCTRCGREWTYVNHHGDTPIYRDDKGNPIL